MSDGWWFRFTRRRPTLSLRKDDGFSHARADNTKRDVFVSYFELLKATLIENDLLDKPAQIYNCDESGLPLDHKMPRVIAKREAKKIRLRTSGNKTQISILACGSAVGAMIPPMVIFADKKFNYDLLLGEVPGAFYGMSENGWMDQELFSKWFITHFLQHAVFGTTSSPAFRRHSSHYTMELVEEAAKQDVIIFCFPPHTKACREYLYAHPGRVVTKFQFSTLFVKPGLKP